MEDAASPEHPGFSPPYNIPWATFLATIEKVAEDLPNKIDRSYLGSRSGNEQTYLIAAFRGFGLLGEKGQVSDELRDLAKDPEQRPARIADLLRRFYPEAANLGETNATMGELEEAFAKAYPRITGASRTKAIRFFLFACDYAGVPKSPLWKVAKKAPAAGGRRIGRRNKIEQQPQREAASRSSSHRDRYLDMLLKKAEESSELSDALLDRIEKLLVGD